MLADLAASYGVECKRVLSASTGVGVGVGVGKCVEDARVHRGTCAGARVCGCTDVRACLRACVRGWVCVWGAGAKFALKSMGVASRYKRPLQAT